MTATTTPATASPANASTSLPPTLIGDAIGGSVRGSLAGWAVRRALLGLLILTLTIGGSAWLLHASIEPTAELQDGVSSGGKG